MSKNARILILTTEPPPLPGLATTGAGMRAWGLFWGLRSAGFEDVRLGFAADATRGREADLSLVPGVLSFERGELDAFVAKQQPDCVVLQHWGLARWLGPLKVPLAIDLAGPHLLERRLWGSKSPEEDIAEKLSALARADYTVCSGEFQRHYFLPFLIQAGHDPRGSLCPVIPFSVAPDLPPSAPDRDLSTFLFCGMFLPWQDPENTLRWTLETMESRGKGRLVFVGGPHPSGDVSGGRYDSLLQFIAGHPRAECCGTMPFDALLGRMLRCGTAIDLMPRNAERELAFPTRTMVYLWAGLPVIHNDYDELAGPIAQAKAGWTLDPGDRAGLQRLIERLAGHSEDVAKRSENARALVRERYTWDRTITPLAEWCAKPGLRAGKQARVAIPAAVREAAPAAAKPTRPRARAGRITYSPPPVTAGPNRISQVLSPVALLIALPVALVLLVVFAAGDVVRRVTGR